ncbi:hypothetical protein LXL04_023696 [Taraxacum kok-saghyz]
MLGYQFLSKSGYGLVCLAAGTLALFQWMEFPIAHQFFQWQKFEFAMENLFGMEVIGNTNKSFTNRRLERKEDCKKETTFPPFL